MVDAEVIERLKTLQDRYEPCGDYNKALGIAIKRMGEPERKPEKWIPCKKEMPPEGKEVMLSICDRFKDRFVIIGYMVESPYYGKYYKNAAEDRTYTVEEVEAWMPPPETCKAEKRG